MANEAQLVPDFSGGLAQFVPDFGAQGEPPSGVKNIFRGATQVQSLNLGGTEINKVYVGSKLVWEKGGVTVPFHPSDLYLNGELGGFYDMSDLSTLWTDTGGTTPVTAAGQTVNRVDDISGNNLHLLSSGSNTTMTAPIYRTDGTYRWLETVQNTGISGASLSSSNATLFSTTPPWTFGHATTCIEPSATVTGHVIANLATATDYLLLGRRPASPATMASMRSTIAGIANTNYTLAIGKILAPNSYQVQLEYTPTEINCYINGVMEETRAAVWTTQVLPSCWVSYNGGNVLDKTYVAFSINRLLTAQEKTDLAAWITTRMPPTVQLLPAEPIVPPQINLLPTP